MLGWISDLARIQAFASFALIVFQRRARAVAQDRDQDHDRRQIDLAAEEAQ